jgi:integrase
MAIETTRHGTHRVRLPRSHGRKLAGQYKTREEAEDVEASMLTAAPLTGPTLAAWGKTWLDKREVADEIADLRSRWRVHIEPARFAQRSLAEITPNDIERWLDGMRTKKATGKDRPLSGLTIKKTTQLLSQAIDAAIPKHLTINPVRLVKKDILKNAYKRRAHEDHDPWTYLVPTEQEKLLGCEAIPEAHRLMIAFAVLTGMREGEQFSLLLRDIHDLDGDEPTVVVTKSKKDAKTTKGKKPRHVALFPAAVAIVKRWLEVLPTYAPENRLGLVFPTPRGCHVQGGKHALYGVDPDAEAPVLTDELGRAVPMRNARRRHLQVLAKRSMTTRDFGAAVFHRRGWTGQDRTLIQRAGTVLRRLKEVGLVTSEPVDDLLVWRLTPKGRELLGATPPSETKDRVDLFPHYCRLAGLHQDKRHDGRHVRWHDLRHTCASSLVAGWWGRRWTLQEVQAYLGHSSITMTERYAHLAESVVKDAARETARGGQFVATPKKDNVLAFSRKPSNQAPPARLERATFALGKRCSIH